MPKVYFLNCKEKLIIYNISMQEKVKDISLAEKDNIIFILVDLIKIREYYML